MILCGPRYKVIVTIWIDLRWFLLLELMTLFAVNLTTKIAPPQGFMFQQLGDLPLPRSLKLMVSLKTFCIGVHLDQMTVEKEVWLDQVGLVMFQRRNLPVCEERRKEYKSIRRTSYELDEDDDVSIRLWVESHQNHVFFYEDFSDNGPFLLGIQTEWQLQQMIRFGNGRLLALDSTFGTNKLKSSRSGQTHEWIIAPSFSRSGQTHEWMRALYNRVRIKDPTWKLGGFIVDDPLLDHLTIREVFQCSVLICFWRVRHAWHKSLMKRCSNMETRAKLSKTLGLLVEDICKGCGTLESFDKFMEDFVDCRDFMDYFKAVWYPRMGSWIIALKTVPLASQENSAALKFYHNQLKLRLLNETDSSIYQLDDWLVNKPGTKIHSYFWLDEYERKNDFSCYWKEEWTSGLTAWGNSRKIPDTDFITEGERVKVIDQHNRDIAHVIRNPGLEYAICSCDLGEKGNLCEHVCKAIQYCREKGSVLPSLTQPTAV